MEYLWSAKGAFIKDIVESYPEPKPAATTLLTLLKRMQDKGFVGYEVYGNSRKYHPLVEKDAYFSKHVKSMIHNYFSDSPLKFASFFTKAVDLSQEELEELKKIVEDQLEKQQP